jgi:hypothetical protein
MTALLPTDNPEQIWAAYQEIERVISQRYGEELRSFENSTISKALQRLGESVLARYQLPPASHPIKKLWRLKLQDQNEIDLSTTEKMIHARFIQWEDGIESVQVGHDTWTKGRRAGFKPKKSIQQALELPYSEVKLIVDMTPQKALEIFERIKGIIQKEQSRISRRDSNSSTHKNEEIDKAINLLAGAVAHKYKLSIPESENLQEEQKAHVDSQDLYSYNTMLDLKIGKWSLRQALNLSTDSLLSRIFGLRQALWGKATSLANVEHAL